MNSITSNPNRGTETADSKYQNQIQQPKPATICVVGLGYVGLPLAVGFDREGHNVVGYDIDDEKVETLQDGTDTTGDLGDGTVAESDVTYTSDPAAIAEAEYVMITVPTPVDDSQQPDLRFIESAGRTVGEHMSEGTTVVLESTVYPGATREVLVPELEESSDLACGEEFSVGYSPERATPGDADHDLQSVVKVVGGQTEAVVDDIADLYETVVDAGVHRVPSLEAAEASKVVENIQRDLNIALVNELAMAFEHMDVDLDTRTVLEAAGTKWNFHDYRPGLVGGHCIPVDPYFFTYRSKREGFVPKLTLSSREVNESMPEHVSELLIKALNDCGKTLKDSRVLVLGLTYKPDVADIRTSKIDGAIDRLQEFDIDVVGFDPQADNDAMREQFDIDVQEPLSFDGFDGVVLATPHQEFLNLDLDAVAEALDDDSALVDVSGALNPDSVMERGISYRRV